MVDCKDERTGLNLMQENVCVCLLVNIFCFRSAYSITCYGACTLKDIIAVYYA